MNIKPMGCAVVCIYVSTIPYVVLYMLNNDARLMFCYGDNAYQLPVIVTRMVVASIFTAWIYVVYDVYRHRMYAIVLTLLIYAYTLMGYICDWLFKSVTPPNVNIAVILFCILMIAWGLVNSKVKTKNHKNSRF